jgi:hypothetical protein
MKKYQIAYEGEKAYGQSVGYRLYGGNLGGLMGGLEELGGGPTIVKGSA